MNALLPSYLDKLNATDRNNAELALIKRKGLPFEIKVREETFEIDSNESFKLITNPLTRLAAIQGIITKMVDIYYGIRPGLLSDNVMEHVAGEIATRLNTLSISDIQRAFKNAHIERNDSWKNITVQEILSPIQVWFNQKEKIKREFNDFVLKQTEEERKAKEAVDFYESSKVIYNQCVDELEWTGTIFQASAIAKEVAKHIDQERKDELWKKAKEKKSKIDEANREMKRLGGATKTIGYSDVRIFAELIVIEGIKNGIKLK